MNKHMTTGTHFGKTFAVALIAAATGFNVHAQTTLAPQASRISDNVIQTDHKAYEAL